VLRFATRTRTGEPLAPFVAEQSLYIASFGTVLVGLPTAITVQL
jgi:hypothetical protein